MIPPPRTFSKICPFWYCYRVSMFSKELLKEPFEDHLRKPALPTHPYYSSNSKNQSAGNDHFISIIIQPVTDKYFNAQLWWALIVQTYKVHLGRQAFADVCSSCLAHPALFVIKTSNDDLQFYGIDNGVYHTWYLSRIPRIYPCKFFLAHVNFYRFNAKNWHFRQILREKVAFFFLQI